MDAVRSAIGFVLGQTDFSAIRPHRRLVMGLVARPPANLAASDALICGKGWEGD
jgi:hypothetical protein